LAVFLKINVFGSMPMLPILGILQSGVKFARASEAQFIGVKRKPLQNEGQDPWYSLGN
jgi:hypothetical protein